MHGPTDRPGAVPHRATSGVAVGGGRQAGAKLAIKRVFDLVAATLLLLVLSPLLLSTAVLVRLDSRGPVLYRSTRLGRGGEPFTVLKFRSMKVAADPAVHRQFIAEMLARETKAENRSTIFKLDDDPRVTRIGRVIRRLSIDELPQLLNVVAGQMSLVGPRPEVPYAVTYYRDWQWRRFDVLPGMTGLWQVSGRSTLTPADMLELDVSYADRWSLALDLWVLARTLPALLRPDRAR